MNCHPDPAAAIETVLRLVAAGAKTGNRSPVWKEARLDRITFGAGAAATLILSAASARPSPSAKCNRNLRRQRTPPRDNKDMNAIECTMPDAILTTAALAKLAGVEPWQLLRAVRAGKIAEPPRCGPFRAWKPSDLPRVVEGLRRAGYLKAAPAPG